VGDVTIRPSRSTRGKVRPIFGFTFDEEPTILYAGYAAMKEFGLEDPLYGWEGDFEKADEMIRCKIRYERHKRLGIPLFVDQVKPATHMARKEWHKKVKVATKELQPCQKKFEAAARKLVHRHRAYIEKVAQLLLERETVQGSELPEL
jgi:ATP-dependent Zn protease